MQNYRSPRSHEESPGGRVYFLRAAVSARLLYTL